MNSKKVKTISTWSELQTLKDVQSFLKVSNFYRQFITHYSKIAELLTDLTEKKALQPFYMTEAALKAFMNLKEAFMKSSFLRHFNSIKQCVLEMNVSGFTVTVILSQKQENHHWHLIAFYSQKMMNAECNYLTENQKLLMIIAAFQIWRHYLKEVKHQIDIYSDHVNLQMFMLMKQLSHHQARWAEQLTDYDFIIHHWSESSNSADALSHWVDYRCRPQEQHSILWLTLIRLNSQSITQNEIIWERKTMILQAWEDAVMLLNDIEVSFQQKIRQSLLKNELTWKMHNDPQDYSDFIWNEDLLFYQGNWVYISDSEDLCLCVLQKCHDSSAAGHFSFTKTLNLINRHYYWPNLRNAVQKYVKTCDTCQRIKTSWVLFNDELKLLKASKHSWTDISLNFITDLLKLKTTADRSDEQLFDAILTVMNWFIKGTHYISTWKMISAVEFTYLLIQKVMRLHMISKSIMSDCESLFTSNFWMSLSKALSITLHLTTAYHSQMNRQTECHNQTDEQYLKAYINWQQNDWADLLSLTEWAYNNLRNAITEYTPFYAEKGWHSLPWNAVNLSIIDDMNADMLKHADNMKKIQETLWKTIENAQRSQAWYYD